MEAAGGGAARACSEQRARADRARGARRAQQGEPARIVAKMNSLVDADRHPRALRGEPGGRGDRPPGARHLLPAAGRAGRLASSIRVTQHRRPLPRAQPRLRLRRRATQPRCTSRRADWMPRNFHRRVEVMFPVEDPRDPARACSTRCWAWRCATTSRRGGCCRTATTCRVPAEGAPVRAQQLLLELAKRAAEGPVETRAAPRRRAGGGRAASPAVSAEARAQSARHAPRRSRSKRSCSAPQPRRL